MSNVEALYQQSILVSANEMYDTRRPMDESMPISRRCGKSRFGGFGGRVSGKGGDYGDEETSWKARQQRQARHHKEVGRAWSIDFED